MLSNIIDRHSAIAYITNFLLILFFVYFVGETIIHNDPITWLLIFSLFLSLFILKNSKVGIYILILVTFLCPILETFRILPRQIIWISDIVLLILWFKLISLSALKNGWKKTNIDRLFVAFIAIGLISALINSVSLIGIITGMRRPLIYLATFYAFVALDFNEKFFKKIIKIVILIGIIQVPAVIIEFFVWSPKVYDIAGQMGGMSDIDFNTGTFGAGGSGNLSFFLLFVISILIGFIIINKNRKYLFICLLLFFLFAFILAMASFYYMIILILFLFSYTFFRKRKKFLISFLFISVMIIGSFLLIRPLWETKERNLNINKYFNITLLYEKNTIMYGYGNIGVIAAIEYVFDRLDFPIGTLIGGGPGQCSKSVFGSQEGKMYSQDPRYARAFQKNQITSTVSEFGVIGFFLYALMILKSYQFNNCFIKNTKDNFWKSVSFGFRGIIFLFITGTLYNPYWYYPQTAFVFWAVFGMLYRQSLRHNILPSKIRPHI